LIVDDHSDTGDLLEEGLKLSGFNAISYSNGVDAVEDIREHPDYFCAVIADVRLSPHQMTGFELARKLKVITPNVKVILMSGFEIAPDEFAKILPSTKVDDFIKKPAAIEQVKTVLLKHIGNTKQVG
jgi:DNA-binding NtrC family response regulator